MIVISGALVLVALVLLIVGLTMTELDFVYASIAVSLVSFLFLVIGILQRRGEQASGAGDAPPITTGGDTGRDDEVEGVTAVIPNPRAQAAREEPEPVEAAGGSVPLVAEDELVEDELVDDVGEPEGVTAAGTVLVVSGRPRYHVDGCRYLTGKTAEQLPVDEARAEGFSPCGVCKPDDALAADAGLETRGEPLFVDEEAVAPRGRGRAARSATQAMPVPSLEDQAEGDPVLAAVADGAPADELDEPAVAEEVRADELMADELMAEGAALGEPAPEEPVVPAAKATRRPRKSATTAAKAPAKASKAPAKTPAKATRAAAKAPAKSAAKAPAKSAAKAPAKTAAKAPAKQARTAAAAATAAPVHAPAHTGTSVAAEPPAVGAAAAATAAPASTAAKRGTVVVIPDRGKFHRADCRYVRGNEVETLSRAQAGKQGYQACGVCNP